MSSQRVRSRFLKGATCMHKKFVRRNSNSDEKATGEDTLKRVTSDPGKVEERIQQDAATIDRTELVSARDRVSEYSEREGLWMNRPTTEDFPPSDVHIMEAGFSTDGHHCWSNLEKLNNGNDTIKYKLYSKGRQVSLPKDIVKTPEKIAELFTTYSDYEIDFPKSGRSSYSGSVVSSRSAVSRPESMKSLNSDVNAEALDRQVSADSLASISSLEMIYDQGKKNSTRIESIRRSHSKHAVKVNHWRAGDVDRMNRMENRLCQVEKRLCHLEQIQKDVQEMKHLLMTDNDSVQDASPQWYRKQTTALSWVVPYTQLKQIETKYLLSPDIEMPSGERFKAKLYLMGFREGKGSHISVDFAHFTDVNNPIANSGNYTLKVTVENEADPSEAIFKEVVFCRAAAIAKLIPISSVQDPALKYLVDGVLTLSIEVQENAPPFPVTNHL